MRGTLKLYTNPLSRGRIARWMLEEVGQPYDVEVLGYGTTMKSPEYLKINPLGKVPTLVHGEDVITESAAICAYLAEAFPEAKLNPDVHERASYFRWLFFAAGPLDAAVSNASAGFEVAPEDYRRFGYGNYKSAVDTLAYAVSQHDYIAGDRFTAADVYVGMQVGWALEFGTLETRPEFEAYWSRLREREAYVRASALDDASVRGE
ncbi:glutathione S-transferase family protein [Bradymonadaceae bacterium TMQ3]|uniref:Glutathione S-transferase family protein n=1 Tax=Lujinxingia sediminis TaxID=2480984 RepID=A0ABY0CXW8_9DELT|nr:glutathione S-transferase family protein [Lujinxingia sediminis]RDV39406.1 glutathione S-transferase family protein [Bradymonadaceae bacterium TMQ3]RVU48554.1 glutathione S-transferase family protein [Lujinxingia sediminis]TXC77848.1 glutathione S-transferase family protein [Bradymonadales bacterium TMQ1]